MKGDVKKWYANWHDVQPIKGLHKASGVAEFPFCCYFCWLPLVGLGWVCLGLLWFGCLPLAWLGLRCFSLLGLSRESDFRKSV